MTAVRFVDYTPVALGPIASSVVGGSGIGYYPVPANPNQVLLSTFDPAGSGQVLSEWVELDQVPAFVTLIENVVAANPSIVAVAINALVSQGVLAITGLTTVRPTEGSGLLWNNGGVVAVA